VLALLRHYGSVCVCHTLMCVAVLNLMRSAHELQISMAMTNGNAAYESIYTTKCESVTKPPYSMNGPGEVLIFLNPPTAKGDRL
jgi:hypothetical protein